MKTMMMLGLAAAATLASTGAQAQTTLAATLNGTLTETAPTPVPGVQRITLNGNFLTYAASPNLPQINGGDLDRYSFSFSGLSTNYDDATRTATYSVSGTISGYGQVVQNFAAEPLTVVFDPTFRTGAVLGSLVSTGPTTPQGFPGPIDFSPANGASISGTYLSNGVYGGGGSFTGAINFPAVPEPATWGTIILGMGAIGAALRRRKVVTRLAYAA